MFKKTIGKGIKALREEASLSQETLAERSGLDRVYISYLENGHRQPTVTTLFKIARGLAMEPEHIVAKIKTIHQTETPENTDFE